MFIGLVAAEDSRGQELDALLDGDFLNFVQSAPEVKNVTLNFKQKLKSTISHAGIIQLSVQIPIK